MNRKQLTLLIALGVIVGGLGLYMVSRNRASFAESGQTLGGRLLPEFPMNEVAQVLIREGTNDLHLVKDQDKWRVQERYGYPADYGDIGSLLRKFWEMKAVQSEEVGPSQWARLQLAEPGQGTNSGTRLEFKDASGKELGTVVLGKKHLRQGGSGASPFGGDSWPDGRYLRVGNGPRVALVSDVLSEVEAKADRFLDKEFIKVEKLRTVSVTHTNVTNSWTLTRETENGAWALANAGPEEKLDSAKTSSLNYLLSNPMFDDVVDPATPAETTGLDRGVVARLETFEGFAYTVRLGEKSADEKYHVSVQVEGNFARERTPGADEKEEDKERLDKEFKEKLAKLDEKLAREHGYGRWVYLVSKWTVDTLLKGRGEFLETKAAAATAGESTDNEDVEAEPDEEAETEPLVPELFK
jgi:hypothetical protein